MCSYLFLRGEREKEKVRKLYANVTKIFGDTYILGIVSKRF